MATLREVSNKDLMRLSLEAAVEIDRLRRGKDVDQEVIDAFAECVVGANGAPQPAESMYLNHSPRTLDAYYRAWRSISTSRSESLHDQRTKVVQLLADIRGAARDPNQVSNDQALQTTLSKLETYCLALHQALLAEKPSRRRSKRMSGLEGAHGG